VRTSTAGISFVTFVVATTASLTYYQFFYVPEANIKPSFPRPVLHPEKAVEVAIAPGASLESNPQAFVPKVARGIYGISNRVVWTNTDSVMHSITGDYVDVIYGKFDSTEHLGTLIRPGGTFDFAFTKTGEYLYHCTPHPYMQGRIEIVENFS
jgi:plastocyanin